MYVITTHKTTGALVDLRMESLNIVSELARRHVISSNGDTYKLSANADAADDDGGSLMDTRAQFYVYIEGKTSGERHEHRELINQAIVLTWNLTAYQTASFVDYFRARYQFVFASSSPHRRQQVLVDADGKLQTRVAYFIVATENNRHKTLATPDDFDLLPRAAWLQDSFVKYDLPYVVLALGHASSSPTPVTRRLRDYDKLYFVDFDGYVDPSWEDDIGESILATFRRVYTGSLLPSPPQFTTYSSYLRLL